MNNFEKVLAKSLFKYNAKVLLHYLLYLMMVTLIIFVIFYSVNSAIVLSTTDPSAYRLETFLFSLSLRIFLALIAIYLILTANNRMFNRAKIARFLDIKNDDSHDTYQIAHDFLRDKTDYNPAILDVLFRKANNKAETQNTNPGYNSLKKTAYLLGIMILTTIFFFIISPAHFSQTFHLFTASSVQPHNYKEYIELSPGDHRILRNHDLSIEVLDPENRLEHILFYKLGDNWRESDMPGFKKEFTNLDFSFTYYVKNQVAVSDTFKIEVFELPTITNMTIEYNFPSYTGLANEFYDDFNGNISGLKHTHVSLGITANNPIDHASLIFSDGTVKPMNRTGSKTFKSDFELTASGTYHIRLTDILGNESRRIERNITVQHDNPPRIEIIYPPRDTTLSQSLRQNIVFLGSDDYGLRDLTLHYEIESPRFSQLEQETRSKVIKAGIAKKSLEFEYLFNLGNEFLLPGDRVIYWAELSDNSPFDQSSLSPRHILRLPSIEEIFQEFEQQDKQQTEIIEKTLEQSDELLREFDEKRLELMKKDEYDWDDQQDLQNMLDQQELLNQEIENLTQEYQEMLRNMEENQALSQETLDKMQRIKDLMEEITNEQLKQAMEKMQEALSDMDRDSLLKAMENMKFSMEDFSKKLENTLELLENIRKEQNIQKALALTEEMINLQEQLLERTESDESDTSQLSSEQQNIKDKLDSLREQLEQTESLMDPVKDEDMLSQLQDLSEYIEDSALDNDMQTSMDNLMDSNMPESAQAQKQALQKMKNIKEQLSDINESFSSSGMDMMLDIINLTIRRLLMVTTKHDELRQIYVNDPFLIHQNLISNFDATQLTVQKLYSVPQVILFINPKFISDTEFTVRAYRDLFSDISNSRNHRVRNHLTDIQKGTNLMIYNLLQSADNMQSGQGGGMDSLMQSLMQMGEEQMAINMMTQQIFEQMGQDGSVSRQMREQMQRLASEQERLAENLRRTLQNNPEAQRQGHSLNQILEEMESISTEIRRSRITEELLGRQERILSRLLDAQRSVHQREFSNRREGQRPDFEEWNIPEDVRLEFDSLRQRALMEENYRTLPREYQELIREFHRLINEKTLRERD